MEFLFIGLIYLIPPFIALISVKGVSVKGTDQYYHYLLIDAIRNNDHKFVKTIPYFIGENIMAYPQFLHWGLSFFKDKAIEKYVKYTGVFFHLLSAIALFSTTYLGYVYINRVGEQPIDLEKLLLYTGIIYALTPYHYDMVNAKNTGISARGLGLLLGQLYLYLLMLYNFSASINYLLLAIPIVLIIFLSSTFTIQFILFVTLPYALLSGKILVLLPLFAGLLLFYMLMPEICKLFFRGQFNHKKIYAVYSAPKNLLAHRYSIWRDWVYDFWKILFSKKSSKSLVDKVKYLSTNSVMVILVGMPVLIFVCYLWYNNFSLLFKDGAFLHISTPIIGCFIVFLATSLRQTRFLGEPERYLEFSISIAALMVAVYYQDNHFVLNFILGGSLLFIIFRLWIYQKVLQNDEQKKARVSIEKIKNRFEALTQQQQQRSEPIKILCNNTQASKVLLSSTYQVFWHPSFQESICGFHFKDLFNESYNYLNENLLFPIMEKCTIDYLVVDTTLLKNGQFEGSFHQNLKLLEEVFPFKVYQSCPKNS